MIFKRCTSEVKCIVNINYKIDFVICLYLQKKKCYIARRKKYGMITIPLAEDMVHSGRLIHEVLATVEYFAESIKNLLR